MTEDAQTVLIKPVSIKVRVDGSVVSIVKTDRVGRHGAVLPSESLPLDVDSFVELELFDGVDRLVLPAKVTGVSEGELTVAYEQSGKTFEHWLKSRRRKQAG